MLRQVLAGATVCGITICLFMPAHADTAGDAKRGAEAFKKATCAGCHPGGGNVVNPKDPLKGPKFAKEFNTDAKIEKVIRSGIKGTPMPGFDKKRLSDKDLKDIIAYLRSLTPGSAK